MATFTDTWNSAFEDSPPDTGEGASLGARRIRQTKEATRERLGIDHSLDGNADDGKHKKVTFVTRESVPSLESGDSAAYTREIDSTVTFFFLTPDGEEEQVILKRDLGELSIEGGTLSSSGDMGLSPDGSLLVEAEKTTLDGAVEISDALEVGGDISTEGGFDADNETVGNIRTEGNTISAVNTDGNIDLAPNGSGEARVNGDEIWNKNNLKFEVSGNTLDITT